MNYEKGLLMKSRVDLYFMKQALNMFYKKIKIYQITHQSYHFVKYTRYRERYNIDPSFRFNGHTEANLTSFLLEELDNGFERFNGVFKLIDNHYKKMQKFLRSLP